MQAYDSVTRKVLYHILSELGRPIHNKLVRLIKTRLREIFSKVHVGKYFPDMFLI
jgi:hypothetical protein